MTHRALRAEIESLEAKIRRRDVVVDEEHQVDFYRSRIPERVNSVAAFNHWRVEAERTNAQLLYMSRADLTQRDAEEAGAERFPDHWPIGGNLLPLEYKFEPAEPADGVTLVVPELLLDVVNAEQLAWLVPGMRLEKIVAVFRALPKAQRKLLVPVPDFAKAALDDVAVAADRLGRLPPFHEWLAQWITQRVGSTVTPLELTALPLPDFLRMNLRVLDADDRVLAEGRDLLAIKRKLYAVAPPVSTGVTGVSPRAATPPRAVTPSRRPNGGVGGAGIRGAGVRDGGVRSGGVRDSGVGESNERESARQGGAGRAGSSGAALAAQAGARGAGAVSGAQSAAAQSGAGQDAESMASLLASAWGVSGPTSNAQSGRKGSAESASGAYAGGRGGTGPSSDARDGGRGGTGPTSGARDGGRGGAGPTSGARDGGKVGSHAIAGPRVGVGGSKAQTSAGAPAGAGAVVGAQVHAGAKGGVAAATSGRAGMTAGVKPAGLVVSTGARSGSFSRAGAVLASSAAADAPLHRQWDFGNVAEHREVERNRLRLVVYPAVEDRVTGVALVEARNAPAADEISRAGIVRLAMLALPQQAKYVSKRVTDDRDLILLSRGLSLRQSLADALTQRAFRECFLPEDVPLPRTAQEFTKVLDGRRAQLSEVADRLATTVTSTLKEWRAARAALDGLRTGSFADVVAEVNAQLGLLLPPDFIESTPRPWLDYLPRYLKAVNRRIERLPPNVRRDAELAAKVRPFAGALRTFMAEPVISGVRPELEELRWMIEEFRVSLFAQELKTMVRVSEKRLEEQVRLVRESQR